MPDFKNTITQNGTAVSLAGHTHAGGSGGLAQGTAFPVSPAANDLYFRNDLGQLCQYDGTRWLGPWEQREFVPFAGAPPYVVNSNRYLVMMVSGSYYLQTINILTSELTTNNASNYWTMQIYRDLMYSITSVTTATHSPDTITPTTVTVNAVQAVTNYISMALLKTGSAGQISISAKADMRRVYT
jgi:hypothetical protein